MERVRKHFGVHHISSFGSFVSVSAIIAFGIFSFFYGAEAYSAIFEIKISLAKSQNVSPGDPIEINFSSAMIPVDYEKEIKISPGEKVRFQWDKSNKKLSIAPENFWEPGVEYKIFLPEGRSALLTKALSREIVFSVSDYPKVESVTPADGAEDVVLGAEDPITVELDKSADKFYIKFSLDPESELAYQINEDRTQFKLLPKEYMREGTNHKLSVFAKYWEESDESFKKVYESSFETRPPLPVEWEKDFDLRLEQAKKYTRPQIENGKYIDVNLGTQIMTTFENGRLLGAYLISSGKRGMDTPKGRHAIFNKTPRAWSKTYGLYMPYWMAIVPGGKFGIHELPEWPGGYKEGANHLGIPVSHGCMRLGVGPAKTIYEWSDIGTPVVVY
ncbi:MAG: YkuD protein [Patescibacteria group bacterium]|nr:YkuD protein [Patescibacteria group bacterium]